MEHLSSSNWGPPTIRPRAGLNGLVGVNGRLVAVRLLEICLQGLGAVRLRSLPGEPIQPERVVLLSRLGAVWNQSEWRWSRGQSGIFAKSAIRPRYGGRWSDRREIEEPNRRGHRNPRPLLPVRWIPGPGEINH